MGRMVLGWQVPYADDSIRSYMEHADVITHVSPCWYSMDACGNIQSEERDVFQTIDLARTRGIAVVPLIANERFSPEVAHDVLASEDTRRRAAENVASLVLERGFDGINMDFEGAFLKGDRDRYTMLVGEIARRLRPHGKHVSVDVVAQTSPPGPDDTGWAQAYDYPGLAREVDHLIIMGYDYSPSGGPPGPVSPLWWLEDVIDYALTCVPRDKIVIGLPFYGRHWTIEKGVPSPGRGLDTKRMAELLSSPGLVPAWDERAACPVLRYYEGETEHVVYYEDLESLRLKLELVRKRGIDGLAFWRLGSEDPRMWDVVRREYLL
ncbi:MAG: glycosyl hydrolase family 18 protein [Firmicutes bacterium]|jgi:spore germination protein YaaH|nr:glycosyl hydrolase family 18 protein [Bacillota bacterium]MDH7495117.1 glycosyl hydrolase family 18 protein [Bacillota bacterium]